jgi:uncharacterized protein
VLSAVFSAFFGGTLIGLGATWFWFGNGRVAGVSGILHGALRTTGQRRDRILFLIGLLAAGMLAVAARGARVVTVQPHSALLAAGLLVGFGTRVGGGCTSGHGVCGLSRLQLRALVATVTFMVMGALTVFVLGHVWPQWRVR